MIRAATLCVLAGAVAMQQPDGKPLFDGKTTAGWHGYKQKTMPEGWQVVDGTLTRVGKGGDIVSDQEFENFELTLEWKIAPGGNSGVFYRVVERDEDTEMWMAAPDDQLIDDTGYPGTLKPTQKTAANYDLQPPGRDATRPAGSWNTTRILVNGSHVEHWLNGQLIVSYDLWTDEWTRLVAVSKFKDHPHYARARKGRIGLQDHGDAASFRNIRIRELPPTPQAPTRAAAVADSGDAPEDPLGGPRHARQGAARVSTAADGRASSGPT